MGIKSRGGTLSATVREERVRRYRPAEGLDKDLASAAVKTRAAAENAEKSPPPAAGSAPGTEELPAAPGAAAGEESPRRRAEPSIPDGAPPAFAFDASEEPRFAYAGETPSFRAPESDAALQAQYRDAMAALEKMKGQAPRYGSEYDAQIRALYDQITGRGEFRYDSATDPLYRAYAEDYARRGEAAMRDTMGRAAALTGGYGSSYAQAVGQQQYDAYLQRLSEVLPETYGLALEAWKAGGDELEKKLELTRALEGEDYARYLDRLGRWDSELERAQKDADRAYERLRDADETAYSRAADAYARERDAEKTAYSRAADAFERERDADERRYRRAADEYGRLAGENDRAYSRAVDAWERERAARGDERSEQDALYERLLGLMSLGYAPTAGDFAAAGLSEAQGRALAAAFAPREESAAPVSAGAPRASGSAASAAAQPEEKSKTGGTKKSGALKKSAASGQRKRK